MIATTLAWIAGNRWAVAFALGMALLALFGAEEARIAAARSDASTARAETANIKEQAATSARLASEHYRAEEQRRAMRQKEIADEAQKRVAAAQADAVAAGAAADQLRGRVAAVVAAGRRATSNPATAVGRPPTDDAIGVLADVLGRIDARAGFLARVADERGAAGDACVRAYESLTAPPS